MSSPFTITLLDTRRELRGYLVWTFDVVGPDGYADVWIVTTDATRPGVLLDAQSRSGYVAMAPGSSWPSTGDPALDAALVERAREYIAVADLARLLIEPSDRGRIGGWSR
jgi:hypothetical protein